MKRCLLIVVLLLSSLSVYGAHTYKIGVFDERPFSQFHNGQYSGISVTIWKRIAGIAKIRYQFVHLKSAASAEDALALLKKNKLDGIAGPIAVSSNDIGKVRFSRPYFINQMGVLAAPKVSGFWNTFGHIIKGFISYTVLIYIVCLLVYTFVYWQLERYSKNEAYAGGRKKSFSNALFLTLTLFLTQDVDTSAKSKVSRVLGIVWVILSIIFLSVVVGTITSSMTISQSNLTFSDSAQTIRSFYGLKLAAQKNSYAATVGNTLGADITPVPNYKTALALLNAHKVTGVLGNYLSLLYFDNQTAEEEYPLANLGFGSTEIAFAFKKNIPIIDKVDRALNQLQEENATYGICARYLNHKSALLCII